MTEGQGKVRVQSHRLIMLNNLNEFKNIISFIISSWQGSQLSLRNVSIQTGSRKASCQFGASDYKLARHKERL